jgi:hypothetical protein
LLSEVATSIAEAASALALDRAFSASAEASDSMRSAVSSAAMIVRVARTASDSAGAAGA